MHLRSAATLIRPGFAGPQRGRGAAIPHAAVGLSRVDANEIVKKLLVNYQDKLMDPSKGAPFHESHDWDSITPCQQYVDLYDRVKEGLKGLGLKSAWEGSVSVH